MRGPGLLQDETLWACVAAMAAYAKELETAEIAYAAIDEVTDFSYTADKHLARSCDHTWPGHVTTLSAVFSLK